MELTNAETARGRAEYVNPLLRWWDEGGANYEDEEIQSPWEQESPAAERLSDETSHPDMNHPNPH